MNQPKEKIKQSKQLTNQKKNNNPKKQSTLSDIWNDEWLDVLLQPGSQWIVRAVLHRRLHYLCLHEFCRHYVEGCQSDERLIKE